jgi:putative transposase
LRRSFKYRLRPNLDQQRELACCLETHRRIYNEALAQRKDSWEQEKKSVSFQQQYQHFAAKRNPQIAAEKAGKPGPFWLAHVSAVSMRDTLKRLDRAFQAFFARCKKGEKPGYPRFRGRDRYDSIPFENYGSGTRLANSEGERIDGDMVDDACLRGCKLHLFGVGAVRIKLHRPIKGKIKTVTVKREADHWYVVFSCDLGDVKVEPSILPPVGIDVGLTHFLTTSDGETEANPRYLKKELPKLRRE